MSLSDPSFIGFFAAVFVLFYLLPGGAARLVLLLAASVGFYAYLSGAYVGVMLLVAAIAYLGGLALQAPAGRGGRRAIFVAALLGARMTPSVSTVSAMSTTAPVSAVKPISGWKAKQIAR